MQAIQGGCHGSARGAETKFGWGRDAVEKGLHEQRTGERIPDQFSARGRHKTEDRFPEIVERIHALVDPESQADPKFQTPFAFTRMTAKAVHDQLQVASQDVEFPRPAVRTVRDILNRLGYRLRRVLKTKPQKKFPRPTPSSRICGLSTSKRPGLRKRSVYDKGVRIKPAAFRPLAARLQRSATLSKWSLVIQPHPE